MRSNTILPLLCKNKDPNLVVPECLGTGTGAAIRHTDPHSFLADVRPFNSRSAAHVAQPLRVSIAPALGAEEAARAYQLAPVTPWECSACL